MPTPAIDDRLAHNRSYAATFDPAGIGAAPGKHLVIVTCMDCRIVPTAALGIDRGDAHVLRNAGGIVTDDVLRSILISQRMLGTREVMLVQHTECGLMTFSDQEFVTAVESDTGETPGFPIGTFTDVRKEVERGVRLLRTSPMLPHRDGIRGFVYDVNTGLVDEVNVA